MRASKVALIFLAMTSLAAFGDDRAMTDAELIELVCTSLYSDHDTRHWQSGSTGSNLPSYSVDKQWPSLSTGVLDHSLRRLWKEFNSDPRH